MSWSLNYLYDMSELPEKHSALYQYFMSGFHTMSRSKTASILTCVYLVCVCVCVCVCDLFIGLKFYYKRYSTEMQLQ